LELPNLIGSPLHNTPGEELQLPKQFSGCAISYFFRPVGLMILTHRDLLHRMLRAFVVLSFDE